MWTAIKYFLYWIAIQVVGGAIVGYFAHDNTTLMLATTNIVTLVLFIAIKAWPLRSDYRFSWKMLWLLCLLSCATIIPSIWIGELGPQPSKELIEAMKQVLSSPFGFIIVALLAPLAEEVVFRGAVERVLLKKMKPWYAICLSAFIFGLVHFDFAQGFHAFLIGSLLGWIYYRTRSIIPGVIVHVVNNSVVCMADHFFPDENTKLIDIMGSETMVYTAVILSFAILSFAILLLNRRLPSTIASETVEEDIESDHHNSKQEP